MVLAKAKSKAKKVPRSRSAPFVRASTLFDQVPRFNGKVPGYSGRGIVTLAGGLDYTANALALCKLLRHYGCELPIEWYYLGEAEMPEPLLRIVSSLLPNVQMINLATAQESRNNRKDLGGWQAKTKAILHSSFREALFLDADCFPQRNPEYLFDAGAYRDTGAMFWPDLRPWDPERWPILGDLFDVPYTPGWEFESGQVLVDKKRCYKALRVADYYNERSELTYKVLLGDKDTFWFAFKRSGTPFHFVQTPAGYTRNCIIQHDLEGKPLFCHATQAKFCMSGAPAMTEEDLPTRNLCRDWIIDLRERLMADPGYLKWAGVRT